MKKILSCLVLLLPLLVGCGNGKGSTEYKPGSIQINDKSYVVGVRPYLNSKKLYLSYRPILDYLEKNIPGSKFELQTASGYEEYEKKLYAGVFDFALPNPYQTVNAIDVGYRVVAKMKPDSVFCGIIVAKKSAKIKDIEDLKGKKISFPAKTALAATMMPMYFLHENGIDVKKDIKPVFVGSQFSSILNAYTGDTAAAATWPPPWEQWKAENPGLAKDMSVIWTTKSLVNNGFIAKNNMDKHIASRVAELLARLGGSDEGAKILAEAGFEGFEVADNSRYESVFVEAVTKIANKSNIKVVAEYVEDNNIKEKMESMGVRYAQGFGIEKPFALRLLDTSRFRP